LATFGKSVTVPVLYLGQGQVGRLSRRSNLIVKKAFPRATQVSDRFHVQRLMNEAVSDLRVDYR
jgi:hypothetical protein